MPAGGRLRFALASRLRPAGLESAQPRVRRLHSSSDPQMSAVAQSDEMLRTPAPARIGRRSRAQLRSFPPAATAWALTASGLLRSVHLTLRTGLAISSARPPLGGAPWPFAARWAQCLSRLSAASVRTTFAGWNAELATPSPRESLWSRRRSRPRSHRPNQRIANHDQLLGHRAGSRPIRSPRTLSRS
jgi:hypothetical protein